MWQGKPVSEWTLEEKNHFLHHLTYNEDVWHCTEAERFFIVKDFMEKEFPDVWEGYIRKTLLSATHKNRFMATQDLNTILSLDNLITYLLENTEGWAWKECPACTGNGDISENSIRWGVDKITCPECHGAGKIKHPALLYAEGVK